MSDCERADTLLRAAPATIMGGKDPRALFEGQMLRLASCAAIVLLAVWAAISYQRLSDYRSGTAIFQAAVAILPDDPENLENLAGYLASDGRLGEASEHLERVARLYPTRPSCWRWLGELRIKQERPKEAVTLLAHAIALKRQYPEAWYQLAIAFGLVEKPEEALRAAETAESMALVLGKADLAAAARELASEARNYLRSRAPRAGP